jgi:hypothetical protein
VEGGALAHQRLDLDRDPEALADDRGGLERAGVRARQQPLDPRVGQRRRDLLRLAPADLGQRRVGDARVDARQVERGVEERLAVADEVHGGRLFGGRKGPIYGDGFPRLASVTVDRGDLRAESNAGRGTWTAPGSSIST